MHSFMCVLIFLYIVLCPFARSLNQSAILNLGKSQVRNGQQETAKTANESIYALSKYCSLPDMRVLEYLKVWLY